MRGSALEHVGGAATGCLCVTKSCGHVVIGSLAALTPAGSCFSIVDAVYIDLLFAGCRAALRLVSSTCLLSTQ